MSNCQPNCGCKFEVDASCVRYTNVNLGTTSINTGDTVETTIIKIDAAIYSLNQQFASFQPVDIEGPINRVVKFGPPSTPLIASQTEDNGTSIGVNAPTNSSFKIYVETSPNQSGLKVESLNNGKEAIIASSSATGSTINRALYSLSSGSTAGNIGSESLASGTSSVNIGSVSSAIGGSQNFSIQLKDGSETSQGGKYLKDTGNGKANWAEINPQKFITANYTLTNLDNGYSIIVQNGTTPVNITVPATLQTGMQVGFIQDGTADVTFTLSGGVTLRCATAGATKIKGQYDQAYLEQGSSQTVYYLLGNVKV